MARTRLKQNTTVHSILRARERTNFSKKEFIHISKIASIKGLSVGNIQNPNLRRFIASRSAFKRVKVYRDYVWVFCKTSNKLITVYPLPEDLIGKY